MPVKESDNPQIDPWFDDRKEAVLIYTSIDAHSLFHVFGYKSVRSSYLLRTVTFQACELLPLLKKLLLIGNIEVHP